MNFATKWTKYLKIHKTEAKNLTPELLATEEGKDLQTEAQAYWRATDNFEPGAVEDLQALCALIQVGNHLLPTDTWNKRQCTEFLTVLKTRKCQANTCSQQLQPGCRFCNSCGKEQNVPKQCSTCQCKVDPQDKFCKECGGRQGEPSKQCCGISCSGTYCTACGKQPRGSTTLHTTNILEECGLDQDEISVASVASVPPHFTKILSSLTGKERKKVQNNVFVPLANFRQYRDITLENMKKDGVHLTFGTSMIATTKRLEHKPIKSEEDFWNCFHASHCADAILCPRMGLVNTFATITIGKMVKSFGWVFALDYVESIRIKRSGSFLGYHNLDIDVKEDVLLHSTEYSFHSRSTERSSHVRKESRYEDNENRSQAKKHKRNEEPGAGTVLREECLGKNYCIAFNNGRCRQEHTHDLYVKKTGKTLSLKHLCVKCDKPHPGFKCL